MKILRTASLGSKFTGSYKECIPVLPSILEPSQLKASEKLRHLKQITKNLTILLHTNKTVKFVIYLNCKVFIKSTLKFMNFIYAKSIRTVNIMCKSMFNIVLVNV